MAQARIERKIKFTVMLSQEEANELSIAATVQRTTAAALVRQLISEVGRKSLVLRERNKSLPVASKKTRKKK